MFLCRQDARNALFVIIHMPARTRPVHRQNNKKDTEEKKSEKKTTTRFSPAADGHRHHAESSLFVFPTFFMVHSQCVSNDILHNIIYRYICPKNILAYCFSTHVADLHSFILLYIFQKKIISPRPRLCRDL